MPKGHTNNPKGRPKSNDTKIMIGIYVPESIILHHGKGSIKVGKEAIKIAIKHYLGIK